MCLRVSFSWTFHHYRSETLAPEEGDKFAKPCRNWYGFITCCSSGLDETVTQTVLARGDEVIATARAPIGRLKQLKDAGAAVLELDVTATRPLL